MDGKKRVLRVVQLAQYGGHRIEPELDGVEVPMVKARK